MIIGIDGYYLTFEQRKGIGTYVSHLVENLQGVIRDEDQIIVFSPVPIQDSFPKVKNISRHRMVSHYMWEQWTLPNLLRKHKIDVLHCPANTRPLIVNVPIVASIHDLIMFLPDKRSLFERYVKFVVRYSLRKSNRVITASNASRDDITSRFRNLAPLEVIYPGTPCEISDMTERTLSNGRQRVIHFATREPRKNTFLVLQAAYQLEDIDVVMLGMTNKQVQETWGIPIPKNVICRGYVPYDEKMRELQSALALLYVSNYEGFGFPVLEAMSQSCPVIVVKSAVMAEVGGEAVIQIKPRVDELVAAVRKCVEDPEQWSKRIRLSHQNLMRFDWHHTAQQMYAAYKQTQYSF